jgi:hypothetical protein
MDKTAMNKLGDFEMEQKSSTRTQLDESRLLHDKVKGLHSLNDKIDKGILSMGNIILRIHNIIVANSNLLAIASPCHS